MPYEGRQTPRVSTVTTQALLGPVVTGSRRYKDGQGSLTLPHSRVLGLVGAARTTPTGKSSVGRDVPRAWDDRIRTGRESQGPMTYYFRHQ